MPVFSLYAGGGGAFLWCGLPISKVRWNTFIVLNVEFQHKTEYSVLLAVSWVAFLILPIATLIVKLNGGSK